MKILQFLLRYSKYSWGIVLTAAIAAIIAGVSSTGILILISRALAKAPAIDPLLAYGFLALCLFVPLSRFVSQVLLVRLSQAAMFDLRLQLSGRILGAPLRQLEEIGAHRLLATLTEDVAVITNGLVSIPTICLQGAVLVCCMVYLAWLSGVVFAGVFVLIVVGVTIFQFGVKIAMRFIKLAREDQDALFSHFRALTQGTKELKLHQHRRQSFLLRVLQETAASYRRHSTTGNVVYTLVGSSAQILHFGVIGLVIFVLPSFRPVDGPTLVSYAVLLLYMMVPLDVLTNTLPNLGRANIALRKIESLGLKLTAGTYEKTEARIRTIPARSWNRLSLVDVTHTYHRERENSSFVLGPINLTLHPGELTFITGGNGSGKTTLAKILCGLYVPESGEIRWDGKPAGEDMELHRHHFSVVFSDSYLFDNLLGLESPQLDTRATEYLSEFQLNHKVQIKDGALSTTDLSQGQRKRLALMTAYLEDREIYIFDEWAADQDPEFKEIFYYKLLSELKARGKTLIVISHDDRYFHIADRIVKLDSGRVEEVGVASRSRVAVAEPVLN
ncbi:MAG TPA: cyclic peptide export ABC transporter [Pyrinomonadaceae bacterium]|jgi:putative ATP-binding cassette transporter|nr:cyclic peptide export ABC transporter [Pyrinomonadaceae bacterium]